MLRMFQQTEGMFDVWRECSAKYPQMVLPPMYYTYVILGIYACRQRHNCFAQTVPILPLNPNMAGRHRIRISANMFYQMHVPRIPLHTHYRPIQLYHR